MENNKNFEAQIDSAPPAAFKQIIDNYNNNINLEESSYSLFSSFPENNIINNSNNININHNKINSFHLNENGNKIPQRINNPLNNPMFQYSNMMDFNKLNYIKQGNNINNLMLLNSLNNFNYFNQVNRINNNINNNSINSNSNFVEDNNLKIDIPQLLLTKIEKKYLIDLIIFIQTYCNLKIKSKHLILQHNIYEIKRKNNNQYALNVKESEKKSIENNEEEKENIINENSINREYRDNVVIVSPKKGIFHCINHNKNFKTKNGLMSHCKSSHKFRCGKCGIFFGSIKKINEHVQFCKVNENLIKCSECNLFFNNVELMSFHFFQIHDKKNQQNIQENNISKKLMEDFDNNYKDDKDDGKEKSLIEKYKNLDKEEKIRKQIELKKAEDIVKKIQLKRQEEKLKKEEELKKQEEELEKQDEELKKKEELNRQEEELKKEKESKVYSYSCYRDGKKFETEKEYIKHFTSEHPNDYPFYCYVCNHGFYTNNAIESHRKNENH